MDHQTKKLIRDCLRGKRNAQRALYDEHKGRMFALCLRYARSREEAEDILQDGFLKVYRDLRQYQPRAPLGAWIRRVMVNTALEHLRRTKNKPKMHDGAATPDPNYHPDGEMNAAELMDYINLLPHDYATAFNLFAIEGYAHREIAAMLGISETNSKVRVNRARKLLKARLEKLFDLKR